jgi:hypothetical protein
MLSRNASLEEIEEAIKGFPDLGDDERAALWLLAWTARDMASRDEWRSERVRHPTRKCLR